MTVPTTSPRNRLRLRLARKLYTIGVVATAGGLALVGAGLHADAAGAATASAHADAFVYDKAGSQTMTIPSATAQASATLFDMHPPSGAACQFAGSTGEQYWSFAVPEGTDLTQLTFQNFKPQADQGTSPIYSNGSYPPQSSAEASPVGGIDPNYLTSLEWSQEVSPTGGGLTVQGTSTNKQIPAGTALIPAGQNSADYEVGIACTAGAGNTGNFATNAVTDYWTSKVTLTVASSDPSGFTWTLDSSTSTTTSSSTSSSSTSSSSTSSTSSTSTTSSTSSTTSTTLASGSTTSTTAQGAGAAGGNGGCNASTTSSTAAPASTTSTSSASSTSSTTSTSSTSTTTANFSTDAPTSTTSTTVPCATSTTRSSAAAAGGGGGQTDPGAAAAGAGATSGAALPSTGGKWAPEIMGGVVLVCLGLLALGAARRRQELERLVWPDERNRP